MRKLEIIWIIIENCLILLGLKKHKNLILAHFFRFQSQFIILSCISFTILMIYSFLTEAEDEGLSKLENGIVSFIFITYSPIFFKLFRSPEMFIKTLENCENLHEEFLKKHHRIQEVFENCRQNTCKLFKNISLAYIIGVIGFASIGQPTVLSLINGKLMLTLPTHLPVEMNESFAFWFQYFLQFCGASPFIFMINILLGCTFVQMEYFKAAITSMKILISLVNENLERPRPKNIKKFRHSVKEYVKMSCQLIDHQNYLIKLTSTPLFLFEASAYGCFMGAWLIFFFKPEGFPIMVVFLSCTLPYFTLTWKNEDISDAYDELRESIFGIKWYKMNSKERKMWLIIMTIDQKKSLQAGPFHSLSYDYLTTFFNRVYNYGIYLNILMSK